MKLSYINLSAVCENAFLLKFFDGRFKFLMIFYLFFIFVVEPLNTPEEKSKEKTLNNLLKRLEDKRLQQGRPQEIQVPKKQ